VATGELIRATPPVASLPNTQGWQFAGLSNDGTRLAFIGLPTTIYQGGYVSVATGPARLLVSELTDPAAVRTINLQAQAPLSLNQGDVYGDAMLSPDGRQVAFTTQSNVVAAGDANNLLDTFLVNVDTGALRQINTDASGTPITGPNSLFGTFVGLQAFINQGRSLVVNISDSSVGPAGLYEKQLDTGALRPMLATAGLPINTSRFRPDISVSDDGSAVVYVRRTGNSQSGQNIPTLRNLLTGEERNVATTAAGVASNGLTTTGAFISADGTTVAFSNNGRNLVGSNRNFELRAYTKTVAAAPAAVAR
jgi:Tol biopolymer transport system component